MGPDGRWCLGRRQLEMMMEGGNVAARGDTRLLRAWKCCSSPNLCIANGKSTRQGCFIMLISRPHDPHPLVCMYVCMYEPGTSPGLYTSQCSADSGMYVC